MAESGGTPPWPLTGQFRQYKRGTNLFNVHLNETGVTVTGDGEQRLLKVTDLLGCVCQQEQQQQGTSAFFTLLAYPLAGSRKRSRKALCFEVALHAAFKDNLEEAHAWRRAVHHAITTYGTTKPQVDHSKKLLLFINPNSGSGRALQIFKKQVSPLLGEAEVPHEVLVTERANHATEVVRDLDLTQYAGLVIVAGDGLLYEVYNGLLARPDWEAAIQFPVGIIPGGSGNGLARSLAHWLREPYGVNPVLASALNVVYGRLSPLDLVITETTTEKRILSFLSIGFGLLADIDIESERLRIIGDTRFAVWAVARCANLRKYQATISFKRGVGAPEPAPHAPSPSLQRSHTLQEGEGLPDTHAKRLSRSHSMQAQDSGEGEEEACLDLCPSLVKVEDGAPEPVTEQAQEAQEHVEQRQDGARPYVALPGLDEPVPDDWETIEDEFIMVHCSQHSHISGDVVFAPQATPEDGYMWLMLLRGSCPKTTIAKLLLSLDGRQLRYPGVEMVPVEALRIVPGKGTNKGYLTVDGEVIPWTPIQSHVLHKRGRIMTR
ncbi:Sphingosine kinase 2 [Chionoecetes opilio]|uniref:sphingosine kinase n=1 Tax=Chionoecetes opilio TaxID=41210 RepID=A0A8J4Y9W1_CHIOP|nr:Sphingosine kinase 2 [Chionoecetes opilio]